jgi:hypothetical protein
MRRAATPLVALALLLATASMASAARPEIIHDRASDAGPSFYSDICGFDVWGVVRTQFWVAIHADGSYETRFDAVRTFTGPGGELRQTVAYTWTSDELFQVIGDPDSGSWVEISSETLHGSRLWTKPRAGVVYHDAGSYHAMVTTTYDGEDLTVEVSDEVVHGQQPGSGMSDEAVCRELG